MLDQAGSQALQHTFSTVAAAALSCLVCVHVPLLVRVCPLHRMCLTAAVPTSAGVSGARLTSLLKPLQRDPGWAGEVRGSVLGRTAAASLGFGSWEAGTAGWDCRGWGLGGVQEAGVCVSG